MINPFAGDGAMGSDFKELKNVYSGCKRIKLKKNYKTWARLTRAVPRRLPKTGQRGASQRRGKNVFRLKLV
jgi:hypothetical protein